MGWTLTKWRKVISNRYPLPEGNHLHASKAKYPTTEKGAASQYRGEGRFETPKLDFDPTADSDSGMDEEQEAPPLPLTDSLEISSATIDRRFTRSKHSRGKMAENPGDGFGVSPERWGGSSAHLRQRGDRGSPALCPRGHIPLLPSGSHEASRYPNHQYFS